MPECHQQNHWGLNIDGHQAIPVLFSDQRFAKGAATHSSVIAFSWDQT